jgi:hypothetical protein
MLSIARNGAKICTENPRVFTERKIRGKVFPVIYYLIQLLQHSGWLIQRTPSSKAELKMIYFPIFLVCFSAQKQYNSMQAGITSGIVLAVLGRMQFL